MVLFRLAEIRTITSTISKIHVVERVFKYGMQPSTICFGQTKHEPWLEVRYGIATLASQHGLGDYLNEVRPPLFPIPHPNDRAIQTTRRLTEDGDDRGYNVDE